MSRLRYWREQRRMIRFAKDTGLMHSMVTSTDPEAAARWFVAWWINYHVAQGHGFPGDDT